MTTTIRLPDELGASARKYGKANSRSAAQQIEFWVKTGITAEENPDLSYEFIKDILISMGDETVPFKFSVPT